MRGGGGGLTLPYQICQNVFSEMCIYLTKTTNEGKTKSNSYLYSVKFEFYHWHKSVLDSLEKVSKEQYHQQNVDISTLSKT